MKKNAYVTALLLLLMFSLGASAQAEKTYRIATVGFYNVENLFDTEDDAFTFDDDKTPTGKDAWDKEKYEEKLANLAKVINDIGRETTGNPPVIIGLCEVENEKVLEDLVNQEEISSYDFGIIHFDSPDRRGIDVALLYRRSLFKPLDSESRRLLLYENNNPSKREFTRDQLVVSGMMDGEKINFIVNHWPSRSGGEAKSRYKRQKASELNRKIIDSLYELDPYAKIISMGDFNDDPKSPSIKKVLSTKAEVDETGFQEFYNPMENMLKKGMGSLAYQDSWNLFDQLLVSSSLLSRDTEAYSFYKAGIFNKDYLITSAGQYKGYPFRSYGYSGYQGGYSDHFPVYLFLIREVQPENQRQQN